MSIIKMNYACRQMLSSSGDKLAGETVATLQQLLDLGWELSILFNLSCVHFQLWFQSRQYTVVWHPFYMVWNHSWCWFTGYNHEDGRVFQDYRKQNSSADGGRVGLKINWSGNPIWTWKAWSFLALLLLLLTHTLPSEPSSASHIRYKNYEHLPDYPVKKRKGRSEICALKKRKGITRGWSLSKRLKKGR